MSSGVLLLIEDDPDDARLTVRQLSGLLAPFEVKLACDGLEALDILLGRGDRTGREAEGLPALVLLDLNMPRMTGLELLERLNAAWGPGLRGLKVVVLSSSCAESDRRRTRELGAKDYVQKPVNPEQAAAMARQVAAVLGGA